VQKQLLHVQAAESARCPEENVIRKPRDADLGSTPGWGFPAYTGGVLSYIDMVGPSTFVKECDRFAETYGARFQVTTLVRDKAEEDELFYGSRKEVVS